MQSAMTQSRGEQLGVVGFGQTPLGAPRTRRLLVLRLTVA